jgi:hypothetical protein
MELILRIIENYCYDSLFGERSMALCLGFKEYLETSRG